MKLLTNPTEALAYWQEHCDDTERADAAAAGAAIIYTTADAIRDGILLPLAHVPDDEHAAFPLGVVVATAAAARLLAGHDTAWLDTALTRYRRADWQTEYPEDAAANTAAVASGARILDEATGPNGDAVWLLTDAGHTKTTILLPADY